MTLKVSIHSKASQGLVTTHSQDNIVFKKRILSATLLSNGGQFQSYIFICNCLQADPIYFPLTFTWIHRENTRWGKSKYWISSLKWLIHDFFFRYAMSENRLLYVCLKFYTLHNPFPHADAFWRIWNRRLLKTLWQKEILPIMRNFSFSFIIFNSIF